MITSEKAATYAWMSQASYLDFESLLLASSGNITGSILANRLKGAQPINPDKIFAEQQATEIADDATGQSLVAQLPNTIGGTSFTVFKSNDSRDGSYTIAVRGTETSPLIPDLLEDAIGVVLAGKAKLQLIESFRYYKQLTTTAGHPVVYSNQEKSAILNVLVSRSRGPGIYDTVG